MSDRGFAVSPDPLSNGFVDNRDKRIAALEAENAALKQRNAELVDGLNSYWAECGAVEAVKLPSLESRLLAQVVALKAKRDDYWARVGVMTDAYLSADNELASARQSRARLVNAVREQRELLKAARLIRAELRQEVADLTTEADAARAWAAAWREAATRWRKVHLMPVTLTFEHHVDLSQFSIDRRALRRAERITSARRAAEAATETQARYWDRILTDEERTELYRAGLDISATEAMERQ